MLDVGLRPGLTVSLGLGSVPEVELVLGLEGGLGPAASTWAVHETPGPGRVHYPPAGTGHRGRCPADRCSAQGAVSTTVVLPPMDTGEQPVQGTRRAAPSARPPGRLLEPLLLALVAYIPQLLSQPGTADADTKVYLYYDPAAYLRQSLAIWDPTRSLGTVTFQQVGYLWPMGPFYLLAHSLGIPLWVAERLWVGSILFAAGAGILYLCRALDLGGPGRFVAAAAFMLSPYPLQYLGRISVLLLPWAGMPWMVALTVQAARRGGWRYPAIFGLVVATVGGINATSLLYVGIAPALWLVYAAAISRECTWRQAWAAGWRIAVLSLVESLWWIAGLYVDGAYGVNVLKYTETVIATSSTSSPNEILRGLGYWYFYGSDAFGPWVATSVQFTQELWLVTTSYAMPAVAMAFGVVGRWRQRAYFVLLVVLGTVLAVGAYPYTDPTPVGRALKAFYTNTTAGLALRSTDRASPMVLLGLAILLGAGLSALTEALAPRRLQPRRRWLLPATWGMALARWRSRSAADHGHGLEPAPGAAAGHGASRGGRPPGTAAPGTAGGPRHRRTRDRPGVAVPVASATVTVLVLALVAAANPAIWNGSTVADQYRIPPRPPAPVRQAAAALNAESPGTRVLAEPGEDFAQYNWGDTVDPVWPALLHSSRPFVTRQQLLKGSLPTADMLYALDNPIQNGVADPRSLAPLLRLMSVGDLLVQNDLGYARYQTPQPATLWSEFDPTPPGLGPPTGYGPPTPDTSLMPEANEATLATSPNAPVPSPIEVFPVSDPRPVYRAEPTAHPVVVDGDASGIAEAAGTGLLDGSPPIFYAGTLDTHPRLRAQVLGDHPTLVVTDSNKKRAFLWNTIEQDAGYTLTAAQHQPSTPVNAPLDLFPGAPADAQTVAVNVGVKSVTASSYGDDITYLPQDQPANAIDGNLATEWATGGFFPPEGQWWQVVLDHPVTTDHITVVQPLNTGSQRYLTEVTLTFDGHRQVVEHLDAASRNPDGQGQVLHFPTETFSTLRITIDATNDGNARTDLGSGPVGFAEVAIPGVVDHRLLAMPSDLLRAAGPGSIHDRLEVVMTRQRVEPIPPLQSPQSTIARQLYLPTARTFSLSGTATISTLIPDNEIDQLVGRNGPVNGITAFSKGRLPGDLNDGAQAALDGNPTTMWSPGFGTSAQIGAWLQVDTPAPVTFDHMDLQIAADGMHSVPTSLTIASVNAAGQTITARHVVLPTIADGRRQGETVSVPIRFPTLTARRIRVTVDTVRLEYTRDYYSGAPIAMPVGIAELGIPGVHSSATPAQLPGTCMDNLLTIDGTAYPVRIVGSTAAALDNQPVQVEPCGANDVHGIRLGPGLHTIRTALGHTPTTGWNIDQLVLDSAPGGGPEAEPSPAQVAPAPSAPAPAVTVLTKTATTAKLRATGVHGAFWLVLGQSIDAGWHATTSGYSLGPPTLIDGFANGWLVTPAELAGAVHHGTFDVTLTFAPQHLVDVALVVSLLGFVGCIAVAVAPDDWWTRRVWRRLRAVRKPTRPPAATTVRSTAPSEHGRSTSTPVGAAGTSLGSSRDGSPRDRSPGDGSPSDGSPSDGSPSDLEASATASRSTGAGPQHPMLRRADERVHTPAGWRAKVLAVVGCSLLAAAIGRVDVGVALAVGMAIALGVPRLRPLLAWAAPALALAVAVVVVAHQALHPVGPGGSWVTTLGSAPALAWAAVAFLGADAAVEVLGWRRQRSARPGAPRDAGSTEPR